MKITQKEFINLLKNVSSDAILDKKFGKIDPNEDKFNNINEFNNILKEKGAFNIQNYSDYQKLLNFLNIEFYIKNLDTKIKIKTGTKTLLIESFPKNLLLLSNPNSGKTKYIKETFLKNYPYYELSYQNNDNVQEWKKQILYKTHKGDTVIGPILEAIASATLNPDTPYFIIADEIGSFHLDNILGNTLKSIFKTTQRINIKDIDIKEDFKSLIINNVDLITLDDFKKIGEEIAKLKPYETTTFKEEDIEIKLWLPSNLYFIFMANYENEISESLSENKGWGTNGMRFEVIHFYNFLLCNKSKKCNESEIFGVLSESSDQIIIDEFNKDLQTKLNKLLKAEDKTTLSEDKTTLSEDTKDILQKQKYQLYISNYYFGNTEIKVEELNTETKEVEERKKRLNEEMKKYVTKMLNNFYIEKEDIKLIIDTIK